MPSAPTPVARAQIRRMTCGSFSVPRGSDRVHAALADATDRRTKALSVLASTNVPMTDAGLAGVQPGLQRDPFVSWLVLGADHALNAALGGFFARYPDYAPR